MATEMMDGLVTIMSNETATTEKYGGQNDWIFLASITVIQAVLWAWLYHKNGPLRSCLHARLAANPEQSETLVLNGYEDANWSFWMIVALHHGLGGLLALAGYIITQNESLSVMLLRIGVSFEIAEDVLHIVQLIHHKCYPPGPEIFGELYPACRMQVGVMCHHSIGLFAGSFVFIFVPFNKASQFCVMLLLLSAVPGLIPYPFMPYVNLRSKELPPLGRFVGFLSFVGQTGAMAGRIIFFPPVSYQLSNEMGVKYGNGVRIMLLTVSGLFMVFVFAGLFIGFVDIVNFARAMCGYGPPPEEGVTGAVVGIGEGSFLLQSKRQRESRRSLSVARRESEKKSELATKLEDGSQK